ncbi:MAG: hydrogenase, partial [bacterium]
SRASRTPGDPESAFRTSQSRPTDLTAEVGAEDQFMESVEKKHILSLLERTRWNVTAAAELAGMKRTTFSSRMKKHGIRKKG